MTSDSFIDVVQKAEDRTGMDQVPATDRTRLLSDNGPGYVSRAFRDYLGMVGIKHILATPFHPQTNGKLERYRQTLKRDVRQVPYELLADLEAAIAAFVSYYNYRRYHKALGNVTPSGVLKGRHQEIVRRRQEVQARTIERRRRYNRALGSSPDLHPTPDLSGLKVSHFCWLLTHQHPLRPPDICPLVSEAVGRHRRPVSVSASGPSTRHRRRRASPWPKPCRCPAVVVVRPLEKSVDTAALAGYNMGRFAGRPRASCHERGSVGTGRRA